MCPTTLLFEEWHFLQHQAAIPLATDHFLCRLSRPSPISQLSVTSVACLMQLARLSPSTSGDACGVPAPDEIHASQPKSVTRLQKTKSTAE